MPEISTPPPTTLDSPSPTERDIWNQDDTADTEVGKNMSSIKSKPKPIYLIVATAVSPPLGIGNKGGLPWDMIRSDMTFFRKSTIGSQTRKNAVIMGRKTYESIPVKFRPLADRINVVVTRSSVKTLCHNALQDLKANEGSKLYRVTDDVAVSGSNSEVAQIKVDGQDDPRVIITNSVEDAVNVEATDLYCIGGAEIYRMLLQNQKLKQRLRILQTQVRRLDGGAFECDTFFPESLGADSQSSDEWTRVDGSTVQEWTGTNLPQGDEEWRKDDKAGVEVRVVGWERTET